MRVGKPVEPVGDLEVTLFRLELADARAGAVQAAGDPGRELTVDLELDGATVLFKIGELGKMLAKKHTREEWDVLNVQVSERESAYPGLVGPLVESATVEILSRLLVVCLLILGRDAEEALRVEIHSIRH